MLIKVHKTYRDIIAICDSELLGEKFEEGGFQLDVKDSFFGGEKVDEGKALETLQSFSVEDATFNIIGEKSVACALKAGIISEEGVKRIQGVPFAFILH